MKDEKKGPRWLIIAAIVGAIWVMSIQSDNPSPTASDSTARGSTSTSTRHSQTDASTPRADSFSSSTGAYMDGREKQLYERDPSSMGYTDADRDFLKEHGVREDEARAMETILHQQGIE